jgi:predicted nuclease of predicted toxin-antitoxin system
LPPPTSWKPSASSATSPLPEPPGGARTTLFIDRCAWSRKLGEALSLAAIPFVAHHDRFAPDAPDEEWLAGVADQGWLVLTRDKNIRYKANEQAAVVRARLHLFVLTQGGLSAQETGRIVVQAYPAIVRRAASTQPPAFYSVTRSADVNLLKLGK